MSNYKNAVIQSAPTAAWALETLTTTDLDLSMGGKDAYVSVSDSLNPPIVSGTVRSLTFSAATDYVNYPGLNIWSEGYSGRSFSIEFVIKPLFTPAAVTIMAPVGSTGIVIPDNYISITNNKLSFVVSDATPSSPYTERYEAYTFLDTNGATAHCIAVYQPGSIALYVNNELAYTTTIGPKFAWRHDASPTYPLKTYGASSSSAIISSVAIYKRAPDKEMVTGHYRALMVRQPTENIAKSVRGTAFRLNDSDRKKLFYFNDPLIANWETATLNNVIISNKKLTLNKIEPPTFNATPVYSGNKLAMGTDQFLLINNVGQKLSNGTGSVGVYVRYLAARHGVLSSGEYALMSIYNEEKTTVITLVEKSDKKIYLRYKSNGITFTDALVASPATGSNSDNYAYVTWTPEAVSAYWNNAVTGVTISITSQDGSAAPQFGQNALIAVGASPDETDFWESHFWWLNVWSTPPALLDIGTFKDSVGEYTLKLTNSLNVSQHGTAIWALDTGFGDDDTEVVNQSRIWWAPHADPNLLRIETGVTGLDGDSTTYNDIYSDLYGSSSGNYASISNHGSVSGVSPGAPVPETIYIRATFMTDDSVNNLVFLKKIGIDLFENADVLAENGQPRMVFLQSPKINASLENTGLQDLYHGARIFSASAAAQVVSDYTLTPRDGTAPGVGSEIDLDSYSSKIDYARTIEFWFKPATSCNGLIFKFKGTDVHSLAYNAATRLFTLVGFDQMYVDGQAHSPASAMSSLFNGKWHLIQIIKRDVVDQRDNTIFTTASGSPTLLSDYSRCYVGKKSFSITSGGSAGFVTVYNAITNLNTGSAARNTLSFFVLPNAGVTSCVSNFRYNSTDSTASHTGLTPERWNLVTRTFTNPATLTTLDLRIGTSSSSQQIWISGVGLVKGNDPFIRFNSADSMSSWFGYDVDNQGDDQGYFDLQDVTVYRAALTAAEVTRSYEEYVGNRTVALNSVNENLMPATGNSADDPADVINRNTDSSGETLFDRNPIHLSSSWQILSTT